MKIIEAILNKGNPFLIPDCSRNELPEFFKEMGYKTGLEVGVWEAEFTEKFCRAGFKMYGVDPYIARLRHSQRHETVRYARAVIRVAPYNCDIIRKTSMEAVVDFEDNSLDFVYIDGMHKYRFVYEDIVEWSKKVRSGGIVSGHDYASDVEEFNNLPVKYRLHEHVAEAVNNYRKEHGIDNFYILGRSKPLEQETINDKLYSWFWFKK